MIVVLLVCGCQRTTQDEPPPAPPKEQAASIHKDTAAPRFPIQPLHKTEQTQKPPQQQGGNAPPPTKLGPEYDVYEALLREGLKGVSINPAPPVIYLSLDHRDPPAEFLNRFAGTPIPVMAASAMPAKDPPKRVHVNFGPVEFTNPDKARVLGSCFASWVEYRCGTPWPMYAERQNGKWVVVHK